MLAFLAATIVVSGPTPLLRAHAHNDYAQVRPLVGTMELGFCSIEADVFLVDGKLLVGHNHGDLRPERDLVSMYLKPLGEAVSANHGSVYPQPAEVILLVDIKEKGAAVYEELKQELKPYHAFLTHFSGGKVRKGAIKVILSGDRPTNVVSGEADRFAFIDGRPDNLDSTTPELMPLISASWEDEFKWRGTGPVSSAESQKLETLVRRAHSHGQKLRFWATPENATAWKILYDAGVDLIGSDRQSDLATFLRSQK